jgi:hypothetical protein
MLQVMRIGTRTYSTRSGTEISDFPECDIGWRLAAVKLGRERILNMPAWRVEELDNGNILIILMREPWGEQRAKYLDRQSADRYLLDGEGL